MSKLDSITVTIEKTKFMHHIMQGLAGLCQTVNL